MTRENNSSLQRRDFLGCFAAVGILSVLGPGCSTARRDSFGITAETVEAAEKIAGIKLTDKERQEILEGLSSNVESFEILRKSGMGYNLPPSIVFNPIPAGVTIDKTVEKVSFSKPEIVRPSGEKELAYCSVLELSELIRRRQVTSVELTNMYLSRLRKYNPRLLFAVELTEDIALKQARRADREIRDGKYRGILHGIPYGVKDLFSAKGTRTSWGTAVFKNRVIDENATVVQRLEDAGAVLLAKLSTGTLASGSRWHGGMTRNPWNPSQSSGGSSAGPASATAAGCVAFAIGTETNGSMLGPCSVCGVTGLRPTFGRVSRYGCMPVSWSHDKVTPICRTVEDCAAVFQHIYGQDSFDNSVLDFPFNWNSDFEIDGLSIGYHSRFFEHELMGNPTEPDEIRHSMVEREQAKKVLGYFEKRGFELIPLDFELPHISKEIMLEIEAAAAFDSFSRGKSDDLVENQSWPKNHRTYRFVPAVEYFQEARYRTILINKMNEALKNIDVYIEISFSNNWSTNVTGHPIVVIPTGFTQKGMPLSITFVGKLFKEAELLAVAKAYQDATDFHLKHPDLK